MQIADESAHQPRFADAGRQREAEAGELPLEVGDGRKFAADRGKRGLNVSAFLGRRDLGHTIQNFERLTLRCAKAQAAGDGVDMTVHRLAPFFAPNRSGCFVALSGDATSGSGFGGAFGRFSMFRL